MRRLDLDEEEKELLQSVERNEWKSVENLQAEIRKHRGYAGNTLRRDHSVNIRISAKDFDELQTLAAEEGVSCQTLLASVLHKYVSGRLRERTKRRRNTNVAA